jgi:hypothetical protein
MGALGCLLAGVDLVKGTSKLPPSSLKLDREKEEMGRYAFALLWADGRRLRRGACVRVSACMYACETGKGFAFFVLFFACASEGKRQMLCVPRFFISGINEPHFILFFLLRIGVAFPKLVALFLF